METLTEDNPFSMCFQALHFKYRSKLFQMDSKPSIFYKYKIFKEETPLRLHEWISDTLQILSLLQAFILENFYQDQVKCPTLEKNYSTKLLNKKTN